MKKLQFLVVATLLWSSAAQGQVEDFVVGTELNALGYRDGIVYWKADCSQPGIALTRIRQTPSAGGEISMPYRPNSCVVNAHVITDVSRDQDGRYFWVNAAGSVRRNTNFGASTEVASTPSPANVALDGPVGTGNNFVFWTENQGFEFSIQSKVYRVSKSGGTPSLVVDYTLRAGSHQVIDLFVHDDNNVTVLTFEGELFHYRRTFVSLPGIFVWLEATASTEARTFAVHHDQLYWITRSSDGRSLFFRTAPVSDPTDDRIVSFDFKSNPHDAVTMTVDATHIYYQDLSGADGPLVRVPLDGTLLEEVSNPLGYVAADMVNDNRHVFWRNGNTTISRLPVNAAAVTRDITITGMEVIQAIQDPDNTVRLVAGKSTVVRIYGQVVSSDGATEILLFPGVLLHGSRAGVPLADSPLRPERRGPILSLVSTRTRTDHGFRFRLPQGWTGTGDIDLRAVINPRRVVAETDFVNNERTVTATFQDRAPMCLVMHPTRTIAGTVSGYRPEFQATFDYTEAMMPCSQLRLVWRRDTLEEKEGVFGGYGPYEISSGNDDGGRILRKLRRKKLSNPSRYCAGDSGFDHYTSIMPWPHPDPPGWGGYALVGGRHRNRPSAIYFAYPFINAYGIPTAAEVLAQELGHNYGRKHVDCGGPTGIDGGYPYDTCTLSSGGAGFVGFDPIGRQAIPPRSFVDYMGYSGPNWTSDYTWERLFSRMGSASLRAARRAAPGSLLLLADFDPRDNTAQLDFGFTADSGMIAGVQEIIDADTPSPDFQLEAFNLADASLGNFPVYADAVSADDGGVAFQTLMALIDLPAGTRQLDLQHLSTGFTIASLRGGGASPTVNITQPTGATVLNAGDDLVVQWTATDPEGADVLSTIRYSFDQGASWQLLVDDFPGTTFTFPADDLPGGTQSCLVEVASSDGLCSSATQAGPFTVANKAPESYLFWESASGRHYDQPAHAEIMAGEEVVFRGKAFDLEEGQLPDSAFTWMIDGNPVANNSRAILELPDVPPGQYQIDVIATGGDGLENTAHGLLTVLGRHIPDTPLAVTLDGFIDEEAYAFDTCPVSIRYPTGEEAEVRMVHSGDRLYLAVAGLTIGSNAGQSCAVHVDLSGTGGNAPDGDDLRFRVLGDGRLETSMGNGAWVTDADPQGLSARVSQGELSWNVEFCIETAVLGGWNGQKVRLSVAHLDRNQPGDDHAWPIGAAANFPDSWGATVFADGPSCTDPAPFPRFQEVVIENASMYSAIFLIDTLTDEICWITGIDGQGGSAFWTPARPINLTLSSSSGPVDLPDDPALLRDFFLQPMIAPQNNADQVFLTYAPSAASWNEGTAGTGTANHVLSEDAPSFLQLPTGPDTTLNLAYTQSSGNGYEPAPGWKVSVRKPRAATPEIEQIEVVNSEIRVHFTGGKGTPFKLFYRPLQGDAEAWTTTDRTLGEITTDFLRHYAPSNNTQGIYSIGTD